MNNRKAIGILDKAILVFTVIFLISLTNSIFLNQIGYFGALVLMLVKFAVEKKSPFEKTGLEIAFGIFILAEILSTIFSIDQPHAAQNLMKRVLLIPVVYFVVSGTEDFSKAKLFSKVYLAAAFLTILAYIIFAYDHFIAQLYQIEAKGPSPFQYVMTAGGLISFTTIYFFAFFINEKVKITTKVFLLVAFVISLAALFASYTRAAWLGAAIGLLLIIILKRKWLYLLPIAAVLIFVITYFKEESKLLIYNLDNDKTELIDSAEIPGKAWWSLPSDSIVFVSAYNEGLVKYQNGSVTQVLETEAPLISFDQWKDNYYVGLQSDLRMILLKRKGNEFIKKDEFISPGRTLTHKLANSNLYVFDLDSGLTVFPNPEDLHLTNRYDKYNTVFTFDVSDKYLCGYSLSDNNLFLVEVKNGLPKRILDSLKIKTRYSFEMIFDSLLFFSSDEGLKLFDISDNTFNIMTETSELKWLIKIFKIDDYYLSLDNSGNLTKFRIINNSIKIDRTQNLGYPPKYISLEGSRLYLTYHKSNRILSIFDPYHNTNIERIDQWKTGFKILGDHPIFGVGDIDLKPVYSEYKEYYLKEDFGHLHNNYIHVLVILGLFGFAAFMYLLISVLLLDIKIYRALKGKEFASSFSLGTLGVFSAFLISGLAEWNFGDQEIITMIWFALGLNIAFYKSIKTHEDHE